MYFNYFYDLVDCPPEEEVTKYYLPIIAVICEETLRFGGSIVHHHGIGKARAPWAAQEYGSSYPILEALKTAFDPNGIMNKGTIIPPDYRELVGDAATERIPAIARLPYRRRRLAVDERRPVRAAAAPPSSGRRWLRERRRLARKQDEVDAVSPLRG